ncbi:MAG: transposase, partial [Candidatus Diapherotrites archaeon]|nr:transposase [Candidatus Diapherotrites archaeon]
MQRTNVLELVASKEQKKLLLEMMTLSSCVWNMANYNFRQAIIKKEKVNSFFKQQQAIQNSDNYQRLGRSYALPMLQKHSFIVNGFFGLIKSKAQEKVGLPKYCKNRKTKTTIPSALRVDSGQYYFKNDKAHLPLSLKMRKETGLKGIILEYKGKPRWKGKQRQAEIHYNKVKKKFYLHQSVKVPEPAKHSGKKVLAIDIGIKRGIAGFDNSKAYLFHNPTIKEWKQLTARIRRLQKIAKTRNKRYSTKQIDALFQRRRLLVDNYFKNIVSWAIEASNPDRVIVGDVQGILEKKQKGKKANQMTHNHWSFDLLYKRLENKCQEKGIELAKVPELHTSQLCP